MDRYAVIGGAWNKDFAGTSLITVKGGFIRLIIGGSFNDTDNKSITFTGNTQINITGGGVCDIFAAGYTMNSRKYGAAVDGNTGIKMTGGTIKGYLLGGGYSYKDTVLGNTTVLVSGGSTLYKVNGSGSYGEVNGTKTGIVYGMTGGYAYDVASAFTNGFLQTGSKAYSVVGDITLPDDFDYTLDAGTTLTVKEGATLHTGNANFATEGNITGLGTIEPKLSVAMKGTDAITSDTTYDVSQMFTVPSTSGTVTYTVDNANSTGAGNIDSEDGKTITITKSGTITIKAETQETGFYAKGEATAVLTKQISVDEAVASVTSAGDNPQVSYWKTIEEAVTAANAASGSRLTLLRDIGTSDAPLNMTAQLEASGNFTLDLAGYTISYTRNPALNAADITNFMHVTGTLTIEDHGAEGKTGGIRGDSRILCVEAGSMTVTGGTYQTSGKNSFAIEIAENSAISISGGIFNNKVFVYSSNYTGNVTGGTFVGGIVMQKKFTEVIPDGYMMYKTSDDSTIDLALVEIGESVYVKAVTGDAPYIKVQPKSSIETLYEGYQESAVLSISAALSADITGTLSYQWYQKATNGGTDTAISDANTVTYTLPTELPLGSYTYYCVVSGNNNNITSDDVTVKVAKLAVLMEKGDETKTYGCINDALIENTSGVYKLTLNGDIEDNTLNKQTAIWLKGMQVTIDLNGYEWKINFDGFYDIIWTQNGGTLTIIDSSASGSGKVTLNSTKNLIDYSEGDQLIKLSGGTYNKLNISASTSILADGYGYYVDDVLQTITEDTILENVTVRKPYDSNLNLTLLDNPKDAFLTYDGTAKSISTIKGDNFTWNGDATASVEGYYTKSEDVYTKTTTDGSGATEVGGAPVNVGTYYVRVLAIGSPDYANTLSGYMKFEIQEEQLKEYTVTLSANPSTGGKLSGGGSFATGETTQIKAEAATGYRFDGWYEGTDTTGTPITTSATYDVVIRTDDVIYTAKFIQTNSLSITTVGNGSVDLDGTIITTNYREDVAVGTKITLNAIAADGYEFVYWLDGNNRVLSYQAEAYVTYVGMATTIKGVFRKIKASEIDTCDYRFLNRNGDLVSSDSVAVNSTITIPESPCLVGYIFIGWKIQGSEDSELIDFTTFKITTNTVFVAVYIKETTTYQVQVIGGTISGTDQLTTGEYEYDTKLTVVAADTQDGKVFSYWKNSKNEIVSYEVSYSFFVGGVITLTAIFEDAKADAVPVISGVIANTDYENRRISFLFDREMPEGYTMIQTGCIATDDNTLGTESGSFVLGATGIDYTKVATSTNGTGQYIWTKGNVTTTWYVRGYLAYIDKDGIIVTIYTNILTGFLSE